MPRRELISVDLVPIAGSRFQPTGFPDIGAATFSKPAVEGWTRALLLESSQSMANHLEARGWDAGANQPVDTLAGLPYVRVVSDTDARFLTSSRTEAHRLASAFVRDAKLNGASMSEVLRERLALQKDVPVAPRDIARAIFSLDPFCLIHGVFFAVKDWPAQPKIARALTAFVEAVDVQEAISGGVKRDDVRRTTAEGSGASEGYGFVPFHRTEYTARTITASFCLDLDQLASYGLPSPATDLLRDLALWEVASLLEAGFRPRTACDLVPINPDAVPLPAVAELADRIRAGVNSSVDLLGEGGPLEVRWQVQPKQAKKPSEGDDE